MYSSSHTEEFLEEMFTRIRISEPQYLNFQYTAANLGISVFYWKDSNKKNTNIYF